VQVIWRKSAIADLQDIRAYISLDNPSAGAKLAKQLHAAGNALVEFPNRGRPTEIVSIRELIVPRTPFLLVYRVTETEVQILKVLHGAQNRDTIS
jgi:addiction module RelE/StbE family toxin